MKTDDSNIIGIRPDDREPDFSDDGYDGWRNEYFWNPSIEFLEKGDGDGEIVDGPIEESGFYIHAFCHPMCCRPHGPFPDEESALEWSRAWMVDRIGMTEDEKKFRRDIANDLIPKKPRDLH